MFELPDSKSFEAIQDLDLNSVPFPRTAACGRETPASETRAGESFYDNVSSPIGRLLLTGRAETLTGITFETHRGNPTPHPGGTRDPNRFVLVREQLTQYFEGDRTSFEVPLLLEGTEFQRRVWAALLRIDLGRTVTYLELARELGNPLASRAVGSAVGRNPIGILVPCHRVVGTNGSLTGFAGGLDRKRWLLDHEAAMKPDAGSPARRPSLLQSRPLLPRAHRRAKDE